ncbi:MAG: hypothetical protein QOE96_3909 [Blastocatellia bacterium]|jgi:uncharacterized membrane protein YuzA (DUF378 family)|nr:hypothetical protein [Blastocatellia bacterium]
MNENYFMKSEWRILPGFLLAPLITPLTFLVVLVFRQGMTAFRVIPILWYVGFFAYGAALIFGSLAVLLFWAVGLKNPLWFFIGGGLIGLIVFLLLSLVLGGSMKQPVSYVVAGSLSALTFRLIVGSAPFERVHSSSKKTD